MKITPILLGKDREAHITSLVVLATPAAVSAVAAAINRIATAEVHITDAGGKLVVSLETGTLYEVTEQIDAINAMDGVVSATLVYHQFEDADALDQTVDAGVAMPH